LALTRGLNNFAVNTKTMRLKSFLLIILLLPLTFSCKKDSLTDELIGKWKRIDNNTQVITFGYAGYDDWFTLLKGYITENDGSQRAIEFLGEYKIKNSNDSISIHWMHSSLYVWPTFYFNLKGTKIEIGDIIDGSNSILVFEKVK
jgi:hypothetical protein